METVYWLCLISLGVINVIKGKYDGAAFFFGIVAVRAAVAEWMRTQTVTALDGLVLRVYERGARAASFHREPARNHSSTSAAPALRKSPRRSARVFSITKKTGTKINT
jgi:hypothetical protein